MFARFARPNARIIFSRNAVIAPYKEGKSFERVAIFPLSWTIVHPIDDSRPLADLSPEELQASEAEFLVLLTGFDETFAQTVHARSSYRADELVYGARFVSMFEHDEHDGLLSVDLGRIHEVLSTPLSGDAES